MAIHIDEHGIAEGAPIPRMYTGEERCLAGAGLVGRAGRDGGIGPGVRRSDAPTPEPWVHWVSTRSRRHGRTPRECRQGRSPKQTPGALQGMNPGRRPDGRLPRPDAAAGPGATLLLQAYALRSKLSIEPGASKKQLLAAMMGHVLDEGQLMGTYQR